VFGTSIAIAIAYVPFINVILAASNFQLQIMRPYLVKLWLVWT